MPVLLFPHAAYFLLKAYRPVKDPLTGRITYQHVGLERIKCDLYDPVQREHAHNYYLSLCSEVSQEDRDRLASEWADIRHAREAEEEEEVERKRRIDALVEESEGVAWNIAKVEKGLRIAGGKKTGEGMDVVRGD